MAVHFKNVDRLSAALSAGDLDLSKRDDKSFVLEMLIHSADVANPCRPEKIYRQWTDRAHSAACTRLARLVHAHAQAAGHTHSTARPAAVRAGVMAEFYGQGDLEKAAGLPITKFFDRKAPNVPKCQIGFINFIVSPLFNVVAELMDISLLQQHLKSARPLPARDGLPSRCTHP